MTTAPASAVVAAPLTSARLLFLATGLAGSFLIGMSAQFASTLVADVQGGLAATPDEASWILTVYTMASFVGVIVSGVLIRTLGIGRYVSANAVVFAATALGSAAAPALDFMVALRALQGFAAGGFGPAAFVAVFMITSGPRLPFGLTLLSFVLVLPATLGPVIAGYIGEALGWQTLFLLQAVIGALLAFAARAWLPHNRPDWSALRTDWTAIALLSIGVAALMLVLSQGTRRFWFESDVIVWASAASMGGWAGFLFLARFSPLPILAPLLLVERRFGVSIALNLMFRMGLVVTDYLVPQFLAVVHGYRPLQTADLMLSAVVAQVFALPLAWWLLHRLDQRAMMVLGLAACAVGTALMIDGTTLTAAEQFRAPLSLFGVGQVLFLAPALIVGAGALKPPEFATASLVFNLSTLGGTTLGVGLVSHLVTEREKFHSNLITETVSLYHSLDEDRVAMVAGALADRLLNDTAAASHALALVAAAARREAWILSFNDAFLVVAVVLAASTLGVLALGRAAPLSRRPAPEGTTS
jgi:DHA2 family multidrug resistance protein